MSPAEALNNAIGKLDFISRIAPVDEKRRASITALASHWQKYFWQRAYRSAPGPTYQGVLERYVRWYTRAYQLLPKESRAQCVPPRSIDVSFGALVDDEMRKIAEVASDAARTAGNAVDAGKRVAERLVTASERAASAIADASDNLVSRVERDVFVLIGAALVGLYLWGRRRG